MNGIVTARPSTVTTTQKTMIASASNRASACRAKQTKPCDQMRYTDSIDDRMVCEPVDRRAGCAAVV